MSGKFGLLLGGVFDIGLFLFSQFEPVRFGERFPCWAGEDKYVRSIGGFFLLAGIVRLIGGINFDNKAAYICALSSFVVEMLFHGIEVYRGAMSFKNTNFVFVACGICIVVLLMGGSGKIVKASSAKAK